MVDNQENYLTSNEVRKKLRWGRSRNSSDNSVLHQWTKFKWANVVFGSTICFLYRSNFNVIQRIAECLTTRSSKPIRHYLERHTVTNFGRYRQFVFTFRLFLSLRALLSTESRFVLLIVSTSLVPFITSIPNVNVN